MAFGLKHLQAVFILILFTSQAGASEVFYVPSFCEPENLRLEVQNPTRQPQRLWTQVREEAELKEQHWDLDAGAQLLIEGPEFLSHPQAFSIKTWQPGALRLSVRCGPEASVPLSVLTSPQISHFFPRGVRTVKLHLTNLFIENHSVLLAAFDAAGVLLEQKTVPLKNYYDTQAIKWSFHQDIARIEVHGEARLHSWAFYDTGVRDAFSPAVSLKPPLLQPDPTKIYFLISTRDPHADEAYVVGLTGPEQIRTARAQIQNQGFEKILVGRIALGHGQENRNFFSRDKAPYSWSVTEVDAFADFAHISCDGSPDLLEERLLQNLSEGGRICFWRYRVVRELSAEEVATGVLIAPHESRHPAREFLPHRPATGSRRGF